MSVSDYISLLAIVVNSVLAIWIVKVLQNGQTNKRYLKSHLIQEIKEIKIEYKKFLNQLNTRGLKPQSIPPWLKLMNIKIQDLMELVKEKYDIEHDHLKEYQINLRSTVTELEEFIGSYKQNNNFKLDSDSLDKIIKFQQENYSKFNKLIVEINDCK